VFGTAFAYMTRADGSVVCGEGMGMVRYLLNGGGHTFLASSNGAGVTAVVLLGRMTDIMSKWQCWVELGRPRQRFRASGQKALRSLHPQYSFSARGVHRRKVAQAPSS
jgi:hypothetical protein